jgi:hypothetical protein
MEDEFPISDVPDDVLEAMRNIRRGPKTNQRLAELDAEASAAIDRGEVKNEREAAKAFLPKYGNEGFDPDHINNRLRDVAERIKRYRTKNAE